MTQQKQLKGERCIWASRRESHSRGRHAYSQIGKHEAEQEIDSKGWPSVTSPLSAKPTTSKIIAAPGRTNAWACVLVSCTWVYLAHKKVLFLTLGMLSCFASHLQSQTRTVHKKCFEWTINMCCVIEYSIDYGVLKLSSLMTEETLAPNVLTAFLLIFAAFRIASTSLKGVCATRSVCPCKDKPSHDLSLFLTASPWCIEPWGL